MLLNDLYLKYEYSNFWTGKFSDLSGLFLFPYFLSSLRIKWTKEIYIGTAILFIFWKSELSQHIIDWFQQNGIGVSRIVDYSDLFALLILPFSYIYFKKHIDANKNIRKSLAIPIVAISIFSFWATTLPREQVKIDFKMNQIYHINKPKSEILESLSAGHPYSENPDKNLIDSLFYINFDLIEDYRADITVLSTIVSIDSNRTIIKLDSVLYGEITGNLVTGVKKSYLEHFRSLDKNDFKELLIKQ
ncbi:hypothetical protein DCC35_12910 [Mangrovivirga cuniculi]|uniref:Uncharacterized protein n=1 Tax=Mangrovivirga cuniculi TaxID=2715131 RepID=A0A4D7JL06_9BACT|nr:hypothetical protein DCC35_12910 [Mangrovivirga cuniculi]